MNKDVYLAEQKAAVAIAKDPPPDRMRRIPNDVEVE